MKRGEMNEMALGAAKRKAARGSSGISSGDAQLAWRQLVSEGMAKSNGVMAKWRNRREEIGGRNEEDGESGRPWRCKTVLSAQ
jgi:hypothetical protein